MQLDAASREYGYEQWFSYWVFDRRKWVMAEEFIGGAKFVCAN